MKQLLLSAVPALCLCGLFPSQTLASDLYRKDSSFSNFQPFGVHIGVERQLGAGADNSGTPVYLRNSADYQRTPLQSRQNPYEEKVLFQNGTQPLEQVKPTVVDTTVTEKTPLINQSSSEELGKEKEEKDGYIQKSHLGDRASYIRWSRQRAAYTRNWVQTRIEAPPVYQQGIDYTQPYDYE